MSFNISLLPPEWSSLVHHHPQVASTMDTAAVLAGQGAPHLSCVIADAQTQGRGRQGKHWTTYPGDALAATFVIRTDKDGHGSGPHLPLVTAVAVAEALAQLSPQAPIALKWPNDVLLLTHGPATGMPPSDASLTVNTPENTDLSRYKMGGILVENRQGHQLIGLGLNLNRPLSAASDTARRFLSDFSGHFTREALLGALFPCLANALRLYAQQGWPAFAERYATKCQTIGKTVVWVRPDGQEFRGVARGLHTSGALQLRAEDGTEHLIHSGEIVAQNRN